MAWVWLSCGSVACALATTGCAHHRLNLWNKGSTSTRPATLEDEVNGAALLHETVGLGPLRLN
jgi:hypothetical protein